MSEVERHRPRLLALAYRMLGVRAEAEDIVQDVLLRWHLRDRSDVKAPLGWLVTTTTRACIDRLRALSVERKSYQGPWLPEPILGSPEGLSDDLSVAFLLMLERLTPDERAAFLLHTAFDYAHTDIAALLGKSEVAVRQLVHRAKEHVGAEPRRACDQAKARELVQRFVTAWHARDAEALLEILAADVTYRVDGGGRVRAARRVIVGADRLVRFLIGVRKKFDVGDRTIPATVFGAPGLVRERDGRLVAVTAVECDGDRIAALYSMMNPDKLPARA